VFPTGNGCHLRLAQGVGGIQAWGGWLSEQNSDDLYLSVISLGEIERGIVIKQKVDAVFGQASARAGWRDFACCCMASESFLSMVPIARRWGQLSAEMRAWTALT